MHCPPGKSEALFWDAACRGFGMRALKSGRRSWIYQYRDEHKRTRRIAIGDVSAVSLDTARAVARRHAANVTQGANPSIQRKAKRTAITILDLIEDYLRDAKARQRSRSYKETERHLRLHAALLHHERAEGLHRRDIAELLDRVAATSGPVAANRLRATLSALWTWGLRRGLIEADSNPVSFTLKQVEKPRDRTLTDEELKSIWDVTDGENDYSRIVRLCLLTGCRREEIGGLRWDEVHDDQLKIGAERTKGGIAHEVPLLPPISETLQVRHKGVGNCVFGRFGTGFSGWSRSKAALDAKLAKLGHCGKRWTLHDLRRTFSTRLHDAGIEPLVVEALLAHKQHGVAAVYNRASFREAKRSALIRWHEILFEIIQPKQAQ
jgi:integrase